MSFIFYLFSRFIINIFQLYEKSNIVLFHVLYLCVLICLVHKEAFIVRSIERVLCLMYWAQDFLDYKKTHVNRNRYTVHMYVQRGFFFSLAYSDSDNLLIKLKNEQID
jgi:hypothetical protein